MSLYSIVEASALVASIVMLPTMYAVNPRLRICEESVDMGMVDYHRTDCARRGEGLKERNLSYAASGPRYQSWDTAAAEAAAGGGGGGREPPPPQQQQHHQQQLQEEQQQQQQQEEQ